MAGVSIPVHVTGGDGELDIVDGTGKGGNGGAGVLGDNRSGDLGGGSISFILIQFQVRKLVIRALHDRFMGVIIVPHPPV